MQYGKAEQNKVSNITLILNLTLVKKSKQKMKKE